MSEMKSLDLSVAGDGVAAVWRRRPPGEGQSQSAVHEVIVQLAAQRKKEVAVAGTRRRVFHAAVGSVTVIPADAGCWGRWADPKTSLHVRISRERLDAIAQLETGLDRATLIAEPNTAPDPAIYRVGCMLQEALARGPETITQAYLDACVTLLAVQLVRGYAEGPQAPAAPSQGARALGPRVRSLVMDYMAANLRRSVRVTELASLAGVGPSHFLRAFREEVGVAPHQYLLNLRISTAERLLRGTDEGISSIADTVGFSSQSHMTATFRRMRGETPGAYRARQEKTLVPVGLDLKARAENAAYA